MKRTALFIIILSLAAALLTSCEKYEEGVFLDSAALSECMLSDMPTPPLEGSRLYGDTLYMSLTDEEYRDYAETLVTYLRAKEDIYHLSYRYSTGLAGGILFLPLWECAPVTDSYTDYSDTTHTLVFTTEYEYIEEGDIFSAVGIVLSRESASEKKRDGFTYNTTLYVATSVSASYYPCGVEHHWDEGREFVIPTSPESYSTVTLRDCTECGEIEEAFGNDTNGYTMTVARGAELLYEPITDRTRFAGARYEIRVTAITDCDVTVKINGVEIPKSRDGEGFLSYEFVAPSADMTVEIAVTDDATN